MKMLNKKILVIAPYPIKNPQHGGQKRTKALVDLYKSAFSHVKFVAVFHQASYPDFSEHDIPLGQAKNLEKIDENPYALDQIVGRAIDNDTHVRSHFAQMLRTYQPDVIHVEQPFLYEGLSVLLRELSLHPRLIFGSQNIEHKMKDAIYAAQSIKTRYVKELVRQTKEVEREFSQQAALVIAVSKEDAQAHRRMGAKNVVIAPNGIEKSSASKKALTKWHGFKRENGVEYLVSFIGSGHPPNYLGIIEMIGKDTSFLVKDALLVVGGGVSEYFKYTYSYTKQNTNKKYAKFWQKVFPTGHLSEDDLAGLIESSEVLVLPITSGGGSNLKTAEAILSGKKIVATSYAFRGFEKYMKLPNIYVANTPSEFKRSINTAIAADYVERTAAEVELANQVQWSECLLPALPAIKKATHVAIINKYIYQIHATVKRIKRRLQRLRHS